MAKVIILQRLNWLTNIKAYSSLKQLCDAIPTFSYGYVRQMDFPAEYKGFLIHRLEVNPVRIIERGKPPFDPEKDVNLIRMLKNQYNQ